MKKIAFLIGILMATLTAGVASASLYDYYSEQGLNLPSVEKRTAIATQCGISDYKGLKSQNIALEACLRGKSDMLGATPTPTSSAARKYVETPDFFLYSPAVSSDTTITLNDLEDIYGNTLTMSDFGTLGYGRIDPDGASVSESFTFTGISANSDGTYTLTGVKSVLAKYPYTQTSGLVRSHSINAIVRFTNTAAFYDSFANKDNNEIVDGIWTYNQFPKFNTSTQIPTTDGQFATKYYVDQVGAGGFTAANVSTTRGLSVDGSIPEKVGINASSTTGMSFDSNGKLYQKLQTNGGILTTSTGLYITTTSLNNAGVVSTTASAGLIPQADTSGKIDYNFVGVDKLNIQPYLTGEFIDASAAPIPVIVSSSGSIYKASTYPSSASFIGFVPYGTYTAGTYAVVQTGGLVYGFTGLTTNTYYYFNNGVVTSTYNGSSGIIGIAVNQNQLSLIKVPYRSTFVLSPTGTSAMASAAAQVFTSSTSPVKLREIRFDELISGYVSTTFYLVSDSGSATAYGQIYRNGVAYGTLHSANFSGATEKETLWFNPGDLIQFYAYSSTSTFTIHIQDVAIYYTKNLVTASSTVTL